MAKAKSPAKSAGFVVLGLSALHEAVAARVAAVNAGETSKGKLCDVLREFVVANLGTAEFVSRDTEGKATGLTAAGQALRAAFLAEKAQLDAISDTAASYFSHAWKIAISPADKANAKKCGNVSDWSKALGVTAACRLDTGLPSPKGERASAEKAPAKPVAQDVKAPSAAVVTTPASDPLLALQNDLLACRKLFGNKRAMLALIGEMEDMLGDLKKMAA